MYLTARVVGVGFHLGRCLPLATNLSGKPGEHKVVCQWLLAGSNGRRNINESTRSGWD